MATLCSNYGKVSKMDSWQKSGLKGLLGVGVFTVYSFSWGADDSSRQKHMGVGGWGLGRDCRGIEIVWKRDARETFLGTFFRVKPGEDIRLGSGMAIFSPDCKRFWFTSYEINANTVKPKIDIFDTNSGKRIFTTVGLYPAWSPDSLSIYMSRAGKTFQLWSFSVVDAKEQLISEVADYRHCLPSGEGVEWYPVNFDLNGNILWRVAITVFSQNRITNREQLLLLEKLLLIDAQTRQLLKEEVVPSECGN